MKSTGREVSRRRVSPAACRAPSARSQGGRYQFFDSRERRENAAIIVRETPSPCHIETTDRAE